ncbi:hypothetical protein Tco_0413803 [Tanacetum coccineum]
MMMKKLKNNLMVNRMMNLVKSHLMRNGLMKNDPVDTSMQDDLLIKLELSSLLSTSYAPRNDGGDERIASLLLHRATVTSYGSYDGGLSEESLEVLDESVHKNGEVCGKVGTTGGIVDKSLLSGGVNKPPMLEKHLYDSWKRKMELYMMNRPHGRMILASVEKGLLVWPIIIVDCATRPKEYTELTTTETIQADCDIKAINIILQGIPPEIYALVSQHRVAKDIWEKI